MNQYHSLLALVVVLLSSWSLHPTLAHSTHAPLLKRAVNPATIALEILSRPNYAPSLPNLSKRLPSPPSSTLRFDDSFRLTISAFDDLFHLHLRPNDHLIHPAARVNYYELDSEGRSVLSRTEPLLRESVKAYMGEVIAPHHSPTRMREDAAGVAPQPHPATLGWARIMVHHQGHGDSFHKPVYEGAFSANGVIYHISTKDNYFRNKHALDPDVSRPLGDADDRLVIWRDSDAMTPEEEHFVRTGSHPTGPIIAPQSCAHDSLPYNNDPHMNPILRPASPSWLEHLLTPTSNRTVYRRDDAPTGSGGMGVNFAQFIGQSTGCPTTQKVVYMGVAADCEYVAKYNSSQEDAKSQILTTWNTASALYKTTFNVSLGITTLSVQPASCPTGSGGSFPWNINCAAATLSSRLSLFSQWRGTLGEDGNGLWHLMSGCPTGAEVGIAWLATLCQTSAGGNASQVVSGTAVSTSGRTEWQVVAHEIGHNFGAIHDCADGCASGDSKCCPLTTTTCNAEAKFIMSPVAQSGEKVFSPCSLGNICAVMKGVQGAKVDTTCLVDPDPNRQTISLQMCGNGIVEKGEDCDPGQGVESACCDVKTCKFKSNAVCDPDSSPCCTDTCSFAPATRICRPSRDASCDMEERCTGNSSACPADVVASNGQSCGSGDLKCASGQCTSIGQQCQMVGASLGLSQACPDRSDQSCQISCQDPNNTNACVRLTSLLVDGSPCGYGGSCLAGKCQAAGFLDTAKAWYTSNLQIAIPVTIVAGLILLLILWAIFSGIRRCCAGSRASRASRALAMAPAASVTQHRRLPSYEGNQAYNAPYRSPPPESRSQYTRVPPQAAHDRARSTQGSTDYNFAANNRNWVDDRAYNGWR